ncbi:hypothetical protein LTR66_001417 [Elasticomyces elasticus]|nr:hypothetical protein LTR28_011252 [Elasticomyces elasticus]KAK4999586.1 hypothetical protein LTR66_001417 [Elasticomyces elasticus]
MKATVGSPPLGTPVLVGPPDYRQSEKDAGKDFSFSCPPQSPVQSGRLAELAAASGCPTANPYSGSNSSRPIALPSFADAADKARAKKILLERRKTDPEYSKPGFFKFKTKDVEFDYKEVNRALRAVILENQSASLIKALLAFGGSVNVHRHASTSSLKKMRGKNTEDERSDVMTIAVKNCSLQVVQLVASQADVQSLAEALPVAVRRGDAEVLRAILQWDAGYELCHEEFKSVVQSNNGQITELLLQAT